VVDFSNQRLRLIRQQRKAHVFAVNDVHLLTDNHINALLQVQDPVVRIIHFGNLAFFVNQERHVAKAMFGDELAV